MGASQLLVAFATTTAIFHFYFHSRKNCADSSPKGYSENTHVCPQQPVEMLTSFLLESSQVAFLRCLGVDCRTVTHARVDGYVNIFVLRFAFRPLWSKDES